MINLKLKKIDSGNKYEYQWTDKVQQKTELNEVSKTSCPKCGSTTRCETPPEGSLVPCTHRFGNIKL